MKNFFIGLLVGLVLTASGLFFAFGEQLGFVGASPSSESTSSYSCVNGVCSYFFSQKAKTATTTLCAVKSPAATTTLIAATFHEYTSTSTAGIIGLSKTSSPFATSSSLVGTLFTIASGVQTTIQASTTPGAAGNASVVAPNTYLVWGMDAGSVGYGYTYGATCQLELRSVQ